MEPKIYYKITNYKETCGIYQYCDGMNVTKSKYFHFTDEKNIFSFLKDGCNIREVHVPLNDPDLIIIKEKNKWRTNKIYFGKKHNILDLNVIMKLVNRGADLHSCREELLKRASCKGDLILVKYLVQMGADYHIDTNEALKCAIVNENIEVVNYLLLVGADTNSVDRSTNKKINSLLYNYALTLAVKVGNLELVKILISSNPVFLLALMEASDKALKKKQIDIFNYLCFIKNTLSDRAR